jgi:hypothetical protein
VASWRENLFSGSVKTRKKAHATPQRTPRFGIGGRWDPRDLGGRETSLLRASASLRENSSEFFIRSRLGLDHGFHETSQGTRFTIGPAARTEVLDRLLELNHARYAEEVARGLHRPKKGGKRGARKGEDADAQAGPFDRRDRSPE